MLASAKNIADFEAHRAELEKAAEKVLAEAKHRADKLAELEIVITAQAGDEGKLFGSVGPRDIADRHGRKRRSGREAGSDYAGRAPSSNRRIYRHY